MGVARLPAIRVRSWVPRPIAEDEPRTAQQSRVVGRGWCVHARDHEPAPRIALTGEDPDGLYPTFLFRMLTTPEIHDGGTHRGARLVEMRAPDALPGP